MKIDKRNFSLLLMANGKGLYEGTFNVNYLDKLLNKETLIEDSATISEENHKLDAKEIKTISQINKIIEKNFSKKGFILEQWRILYSYNTVSEIRIEYKFGDTLNTTDYNLIEDHTLCKKALTLSRSITRRMLRELK